MGSPVYEIIMLLSTCADYFVIRKVRLTIVSGFGVGGGIVGGFVGGGIVGASVGGAVVTSTGGTVVGTFGLFGVRGSHVTTSSYVHQSLTISHQRFSAQVLGIKLPLKQT